MTDDRWTEMDELMLRRSTRGLTSAEVERLAELLESAPAEDRDWIDRLLGELDAELAVATGDDSELPAGLRASLMASAAETARAMASDRAPTTPVDPEPTVAGSIGGDAPRSTERGFGATAWIGWAAAATVAFLWLGSSETLPGDESGVVVAPDPMAYVLSAAELPDAVRLDWTATDDPTAADGVTGEVVWSASEQRGYMRFAGLQANAPDDFQYQLWIFDAERDERFPVDGGVFDIPADGGEVIVPIDARLPVNEATLFAVTVEPPGGVVVSDRSRIAVVAAAE